MPTGYYMVSAPLALLGLDPLGAARWVSWAGVTAFGLVVGFSGVRAGANRFVAAAGVGAWLCLARVVAIANIARMEGAVLALAAVSLVLIGRDRWPAAVAVAALAPLVHPIGVIVTVAVLLSGIVRRPERRLTMSERVLLAVAAVAWLAEVAYFMAHADAAAAHLRFQFTRKGARGLTVHAGHQVLLAATALAGAAASVRWRRGTPALAAIHACLALAGGFVIVDVVGQEMWYHPLGRETALLLLGMAAAAGLSRLSAPAAVRSAAAALAGVALVAVAVVGLRFTLVHGWFGMQPDSATRSEWTAFVDDAVARLARFDGQGDTGELVVVDPLSGFGQELIGRPWQRLRFVQPTPATPMDTVAADYVLATPGAPFVTEPLVEQWGAATPALEVRSARGTYTLQLIENPS
jgi:hypothetical protein